MSRRAEHPTILLDNWDHEFDIEPEFVGRQSDLELFLHALNGPFRLFGVFGMRAVGKSRLVKELIYQYIENNDVRFRTTVIRLDFSNHRSVSTVYTNLFACLGEVPEPHCRRIQIWMDQIVNYLRVRQHMRYIFIFDNTEHTEEIEELHESLKSLSLRLAYNCKNVKIFITSTTKFMSSRLRRIYFSHELLPLSPLESAKLFKTIVPNVELGECEGPIVKLSEGLPLLISMIANELADDGGLITPNDMVSMLVTNRLKCLSRQEYYSEEERIADKYKQFLERLQPNNLRNLSLLGYIPGSFDIGEAKEILGFKEDHEVQDQVLIPVRRRFMLTYDAQTGRFNIQGILRDCLEVYFVIKNIAEVRKRFVKTFSTVMTELCRKLGTEEYVNALSLFSLEQPNFQKLLIQVPYTTEDTYQFFITIATSCTSLIERYMQEECDKFLKGCQSMADRYGNAVDKAMVSIAVGSMWTNTKDDLVKGADYYQEALKILTPTGNWHTLAKVYNRMGINLYKQGTSVEAHRKFQKALKLSKNEGPEFQRVIQTAKYGLGITNTMLGNFDEAERYLFACLAKAKKVFGNGHPKTAGVINSIGVMYAAKGDSENALKYYIEGLELKRKTNAPLIDIVKSLSNTANEYRALNKYVEAHELLDEGFKLFNTNNIPSRAELALIYDTEGKVLTSEGRYTEALVKFEKAVEIREAILPDHIVYVESLVHVAIAKQGAKLYNSSVKAAKKALDLRMKAKDSMPQNPYIAECYECLADVYMKTGRENLYLETLELLESELYRLEQVHICSCNDLKVERVREQLVVIRGKLQNENKRF